ncbi:Enoyl-CoA hydratase / 3-hydroxyacyl-CoA dehydrogenase / 3-hydroxybutyryl-CoA epimerase [Actinomycetales bacterium JB111]|nr:Enoyl-CoA hydratase / 3-hydroxyacyl-CoA dehydrogenase / 3-hydroxybutyryl-CoA epimerase [Actinomycetales bacterium JB111]
MPQTLESPERALVVSRDDRPSPIGTIAVLTLSAPSPGRPTTIGDLGLGRLRSAVDEVAADAAEGRVVALVLTGTERSFLAGADLDLLAAAESREAMMPLARAGHDVVSAIRGLAVPTMAHLTGATLGGGYEIALATGWRVASRDVRAIGLPETSLAILPGWGGCTLLPRLVGPEQAATVILDLPAKDRTLRATDALAAGLVDGVVDAGDDLGLAAAIDLFATAITAGTVTAAPNGGRPDADLSQATTALARRRTAVVRAAATGNPAPLRAWELLEQTGRLSVEESFAIEDEALTDLATGDACRTSIYAAGILRKARSVARKDAGSPAARPVETVGVIGAGLMAAQLALLLARTLSTPVVMRDLDEERTAAGLAAVAKALAADVEAGRLTQEKADAVSALVTATTDLADLAGADLVVEAVSERLDIKKAVFAEVEGVVRADTVLATNTSALSVTAMAEDLAHPERVVGLHFFNPVARMPLVEVVRTAATDDATHATARAVAGRAGKIAVDVRDAPGFVVNRLLLRLLAEVLGAAEDGTSVSVVDRALDPMGLPMRPFALLDLVGPAVAEHALDALRDGLDGRYPVSPALSSLARDGARATTADGRLAPDLAARFGQGSPDGPTSDTHPLTEAGVLDRVVAALGEETRLVLAEGIVADESDVNLAMILGAGFPRHRGGLTPYLRNMGEMR